jgi:hypothetical protein
MSLPLFTQHEARPFLTTHEECLLAQNMKRPTILAELDIRTGDAGIGIVSPLAEVPADEDSINPKFAARSYACYGTLRTFWHVHSIRHRNPPTETVNPTHSKRNGR